MCCGYGKRSGEVAREIIRILVTAHGFTEQDVEEAGRTVLAEAAKSQDAHLESDSIDGEPARGSGANDQAAADAVSETLPAIQFDPNAYDNPAHAGALLEMVHGGRLIMLQALRPGQKAALPSHSSSGRLGRSTVRTLVGPMPRSPGRPLRRQGAGTSTSASRLFRSPGVRSTGGTASRSGTRATAPERTSQAAVSW